MHFYDWVVSHGSLMAAPLAAYPGVALAGGSVGEALLDPEAQLEALRALAGRMGPDIVFSFMDLTVEAEALGRGVRFYEQKPPDLEKVELMRPEDLPGLEVPDPELAGRMPLFLKVAEGLSSSGGRMCGAFVTGPFTLMTRLVESSGLFSLLREGRDLRDAAGFATTVVGEYAAALAGRVDLVVVVDPEAQTLNAEEYRSLCAPYINALAGIVRASGAACVLYVRGDISHLLGEIPNSGVEGIFLDSRMSLPRSAEVLPDNLVILGNIDPRRVLELGTSEDVRRNVKRLLRRMDGIRNFVLSTGGDVPLQAPMANLEAMMEEARAWRSRTFL